MAGIVWAPNSGFNRKQLFEEPASLTEAFLCKHHGFRLTTRIADKPAFVQTVQCVPIKAFPRPCSIVKSKVEQRQNGSVYFVIVEFHKFFYVLSLQNIVKAKALAVWFGSSMNLILFWPPVKPGGVTSPGFLSRVDRKHWVTRTASVLHDRRLCFGNRSA